MKKTATTIATLALLASPVFAFAHEDAVAITGTANVSATTSVKVRTGERAEVKAEAQARFESEKADRIADAKERAGKEIERRIEHLKKLMERLDKMVRVSDDTESSLDATIQGQISALTTLEAQIMGTSATSSLRSYIESITKSYRIYALVMPQISIIAAADRALAAAAQLEQFSAKLDARIDAAASAGSEVSSLEASLAEMNAKIASAKQKASEAVEAVKTLTPDNGDQAKQQSNLAELKAAHEKIRSAQEDLKAARKIAGEIVRGLRALAKPERATTTPSTATSTDDDNDDD